jgi:hypothetical protein
VVDGGNEAIDFYIMGERLELDEWSTERLSNRIPLPAELARDLSLKPALRG